jgi:acetate CoA/acetoacetate CoA-transferase alpha subunit
MKRFISAEELRPLLFDGMTVMVGGFLADGSPEKLIGAVLASGVTDLTIICNDGGWEDRGVGRLIVQGRVKKLIASHIGTNPTCGKLMQEGRMAVELVPQGTLVERIRAKGAGLGGILTPTGLGTVVQDGKRIVNVGRNDYLLEVPLSADLALLGGAIADRFGNLRYIGSKRNFNPIMALAADTVVAEASAVVDELDPEIVVTPYPVVDYIVMGD